MECNNIYNVVKSHAHSIYTYGNVYYYKLYFFFSQGTYGEMKLVQANLETDEPNNGN